MDCQKFLRRGLLIEHVKFNLKITDFIEIDNTRTPNRVDVFGTCITLPGHAEESQAAADPCRLQLCAVLRSSGIKLSEYIRISYVKSAPGSEILHDFSQFL